MEVDSRAVFERLSWDEGGHIAAWLGSQALESRGLGTDSSPVTYWS